MSAAWAWAFFAFCPLLAQPLAKSLEFHRAAGAVGAMRIANSHMTGLHHLCCRWQIPRRLTLPAPLLASLLVLGVLQMRRGIQPFPTDTLLFKH